MEAVNGFPADRSATASTCEDEVIQLFDQMHGPLLRYVLAIGVSAADAEEVIQEVFLALFRHLRGGKSRQNLRGWLFRVAHNLALKQCQKNRNSWLAEAHDRVAEQQLAPGPILRRHWRTVSGSRV